MPRREPPALVFDLDGTLIDSLPGIASALNQALTAANHPGHERDAVRTFIGHGSLELARRALPRHAPESLIAEVEARFREIYAQAWPGGTRMYPGIEPLIARLVGDGHSLAVLSNKPHPFTCEIVARLFGEDVFDAVRGQTSPDAPRKPAPGPALDILHDLGVTPQNARLIGDSSVDRETAANARIPFIGVSWGYHEASRLGSVVASSPGEILRLLRSAPEI